MRRLVVIVLIAVVIVGGVIYYRSNGAPASAAAPGAGGPGGPGGGNFGRPPLTVDVASATRSDVAEELTVVGNLGGAASVEVVPKVNGRLESVSVRIGDRVTQGQPIAKVEDREIREQVKQAEAAFEVAQATIRQREADLKLAETTLERSRNLFSRQLLAQQVLEDAEARYTSATAQLDLARAQFSQAQARLQELRFTLNNTVIVSPVNGFVGKRYLDPGAFVSTNAPVASVVDLNPVRLVANLVERDLRRVQAGTMAHVEVDALPGETFTGRVARVAPVLDPNTRTAEIEIEIPNEDYRLKPGMYARIALLVDQRADALVVPRNAVVDLNGQRGVFVPEDQVARFVPVETGTQTATMVEITSGLDEGTQVVTTGAAGLQDGDRIVLPGQGGGEGRRGQGPGGGPGGGAPQGSRRPAAQ